MHVGEIAAALIPPLLLLPPLLPPSLPPLSPPPPPPPPPELAGDEEVVSEDCVFCEGFCSDSFSVFEIADEVKFSFGDLEML